MNLMSGINNYSIINVMIINGGSIKTYYKTAGETMSTKYSNKTQCGII